MDKYRDRHFKQLTSRKTFTGLSYRITSAVNQSLVPGLGTKTAKRHTVAQFGRKDVGVLAFK